MVSRALGFKKNRRKGKKKKRISKLDGNFETPRFTNDLFDRRILQKRDRFFTREDGFLRISKRLLRFPLGSSRTGKETLGFEELVALEMQPSTRLRLGSRRTGKGKGIFRFEEKEVEFSRSLVAFLGFCWSL